MSLIINKYLGYFLDGFGGREGLNWIYKSIDNIGENLQLKDIVSCRNKIIVYENLDLHKE